MSILFVVAGLAGAAGVALLVQSKPPLPTEADYNKAMDKWMADPKDANANLVLGKYLAFVLGDYKTGMTFLSNSNDPTLKALGEHEIDPDYTNTPAKKVTMGDEWVAAGKKMPALSRIFYDRANQWYIAAWPAVDKASKPKVRERGLKLAVSRPIGPERKGVPSGWVQHPGLAGRPAALDGNVARIGSYSVRIPPADEKVPGSGSTVASEMYLINGKTLEASAYILVDGTENVTDCIYAHFFTNDLKPLGNVRALIQTDTPFWNRVALKTDVPKDAAIGQFSVALYSKKGSMWVDDASVKVDGKEVLKNTSFEDK